MAFNTAFKGFKGFEVGKKYRIIKGQEDNFLRILNTTGKRLNTNLHTTLLSKDFIVEEMIGYGVSHSMQGDILIYGAEFKFFEEVPEPDTAVDFKKGSIEFVDGSVIVSGDVVITVKSEQGRLAAIDALQKIKFK
ncbi:hypothetical protein [Escherichia phage vB_EcoM_EP32a]|nr:hypothetical protein [Escherichia phage vB_EcoM_EP32a]